jgi:hypothetical protein
MRYVNRAALLGLLVAMSALAQRDLGTIVGTVTDPQGSVIAKSKVTITEDATGLKYEVETSSGGEYIRPALKAGTYSVSAESPGFKKTVQRNVVLTAGDRVGVNIQLAVGEVTQSIDVSEDIPVLQTESAVLGANITAKQVSELPLGGTRNFVYLARLSPGVVPAEPGARDATGGGFSANGVRSNGQNNFLLNGVDNNVNVIDFLNQTAYVIGPAVDAIGELRVLTNGYNAEYGRGAGGVVNVTLKSGTNQVHGTAFEYLQNDKLNANRWENNFNNVNRGPFKQNQFGGSVGGPAIKNRTFWFGDYQQTEIRSLGGSVPGLGTSSFFTIPTGAMRGGDFSQLLSGPNASIIYDPATQTTSATGQLLRTPFQGNRIPASRLDPASLKIAALFPQETPTVGFPTNNYFVTTSGTETVKQFDVRMDHKISDKDSIFGSLSWSNTSKFNGQPLPGALDATYFNSNEEIDLSRNAQISYARVWTPSIISETRVGFTRLVTSRTQADPNTDQFTKFGIGGYNPTTTLNGGLPSTNLGRYSGFGASDWLPSKEYNNVLDFIQNVSLTRNGHAFKFGAEYRPIKFPFFQVPSPHGDLSFGRVDTALPGQQTTSGDELASFMLGRIDSGQISTSNFISSQKSAWGFYAQDDWKVNSKLTLNLGVRYELFSPIDERFGRQSNFDFNTLTLYIPKGKDQNAALPPNFAQQFPNVKVSRGEVPSTLIPWDKTNFGPRVGLAYNAAPKTVVRVGYGIFYGGEENQGGYPNRGEAAPFNSTVVLNRNDPFQPNQFFAGTEKQLTSGFPSNVFTLPAPISFRAVEKNFRNPLVQKWNVAVQREFGRGNSLEVSYVGNHSAHQIQNPDPNACYNSANSINPGCTNLRPYPNIGGIADTASFGYGNYGGMTVRMEKRFAQGLSYTGSYTWGHALATSGTTLSGSAGQGSKDPRNYSLGYSSAAWDVRHNFVGNMLYDLPIGKGRKFLGNAGGVENALLGGWQFNTIVSIRTGAPFTLGTNDCPGQWSLCTPDVLSGQNPAAEPAGGRATPFAGGGVLWFNTAAVTKPTRSAPSATGNIVGSNGTLGLQSNNAPGQQVVDVSLFKAFRLTERFSTQFRAEAFNAMNRTQYSRPDNTQGSNTFGVVNSSQQGTERKLQGSLRILF